VHNVKNPFSCAFRMIISSLIDKIFESSKYSNNIARTESHKKTRKSLNYCSKLLRGHHIFPKPCDLEVTNKSNFVRAIGLNLQLRLQWRGMPPLMKRNPFYLLFRMPRRDCFCSFSEYITLSSIFNTLSLRWRCMNAVLKSNSFIVMLG